MQQHEQARLSEANRYWEMLVQFRNRIYYERSSLRVVKYRDETPTFLTYSPAQAGSMHAGQFAVLERRVQCPRVIQRPASPHDRIQAGSEALRAPSRAVRWWRAVTAVTFGLTARVVGEFHARTEITFSSVLLAILSWTISQILAGYAAYARTIHPYPACMDVSVDRDDPASGSPPEQSGKQQTRTLKASRDISPGAGEESRSSGRLLQWRQARPGVRDEPRRDIGYVSRHGDHCG